MRARITSPARESTCHSGARSGSNASERGGSEHPNHGTVEEPAVPEQTSKGPGRGATLPLRRRAAIGRQAGRGLRWALAGTVVGKLGSFVVSLVLARLLAPEDFGILRHCLGRHAVRHPCQRHGRDRRDGSVARPGRGHGAHGTNHGALLQCRLVRALLVRRSRFAALAGSPDATPVVRLLTAAILIDGVMAVRVGMHSATLPAGQAHDGHPGGLRRERRGGDHLAAAGAGAYSFALGQLVPGVRDRRLRPVDRLDCPSAWASTAPSRGA